MINSEKIEKMEKNKKWIFKKENSKEHHFEITKNDKLIYYKRICTSFITLQ